MSGYLTLSMTANSLNLPSLEQLKAEQARRARRKIATFYPDAGPLRRELYVKHLEFFRAGAENRERLFMAGNRCGKSECGAYELTCHLTGIYPHWWEGKRFTKPIRAWAVGETSKTVHKDVLQPKLLGMPGEIGTGMIPGDLILRTISRAGLTDAIETVYVKFGSNGRSVLHFKSYEQGRESFQGSEMDVIWLDEEPPIAVYTECLLRTMTTNGIVYLTFTPLKGITEVVQSFIQKDKALEESRNAAPAEDPSMYYVSEVLTG